MNAVPLEPQSQITIGRLNCTYLIPDAHPAPEALRHRLDTVSQAELRSNLGQFLQSILDTNDPSIWLIRRLDTELTLEAEAVDDGGLAASWARQLALAIARTVWRGEEGDSVVRYSDRATYLARFAIDVAQGRAWGKWYYAEHFGSLAALTDSLALREALTRDPSLTAAAIFLIAGSEYLETLLRVLTPGDARQIFENCFAENGRPADRTQVDALVAVWRTAELDDEQASSSGNALRMYCAVRRAFPALPADSALRSAIQGLLEIARSLYEKDANPTFRARIREGDWRNAIRAARGTVSGDALVALAWLRQIAGGDSAWIKETIDMLDAGPVSPVGSTTVTRTTRRGGLFLLLPSLIEIAEPCIQHALALMDASRTDASAALRILVGLKCLGQASAQADPLFERVLGFDGAAERADFDRVLSDCLPFHRAVLRTLLKTLVERTRANGQWLAVEWVNVEQGEGTLLLRDMEHDEWIYGEVCRDPQEAMRRGLAVVREATGMALEGLLVLSNVDAFKVMNPAPILLWSEERADASELKLDDGTIVWTTVPEYLAPATRALVKRYLQHAKPATTELSYFASPNRMTSELEWSLVARAVVKTFARHLVGFEWSSAPYLYTNFLSGEARAQVHDSLLSVVLPPPPLALVLRMTGMDDLWYELPWGNLSQQSVGVTLARE